MPPANFLAADSIVNDHLMCEASSPQKIVIIAMT